MAFTEQTITKTISIPATTSVGVNASSPLVNDSFEQVVRGGGVQESYMIYEFYGGDNADVYFQPWRATRGAGITVIKVELVFWHNMADLDNPIKSLDFVRFEQGATIAQRPSTQSHNTLWDLFLNQSDGKYVSQEIHGIGKVKTTVALGTTGSAATTDALNLITNATQALRWMAVGLSRTTSTTNEEGKVFVGGNTLLHGEGSIWEAVDENEIIDFPRLIITYENTAGGSWSQFFMHYTTSDPTSNQSTPSNSIGGHRSPNEVYVNSQIEDDTGVSDTTISLSSGTTFPELTGMVQIGPEIMKYGGIDTTNDILNNVSRGIVPVLFPMPSSTEPFKEYANFLEIDRLFNRRPTSGLVQYRCVAFLYDDISVSVSAAKVHLIQNSDADVQIDVGIEVPEYDAHNGATTAAGGVVSTTFTATESDAGSPSAQIFALHQSKGAIPNGSDIFENGYVVFDPGTTDTIAQITSFDITGTTPNRVATFIIDRDLTASGFGAATAFRINPGPSQVVDNETIAPTENSNRFLGFLGDGGSNLVGFNNIKERNSTMLNYDVFYLWIKRTLTNNKKTTPNTGALILIEFNDSDRQA